MSIEIIDVIFAVDSVPAIFAITQEPFIIFTSNIFAIIGLRTLYFTLSATVHRFYYLKYALALVLIFIGSKIFLGDFVFDGKVPPMLSLSVTLGLILGGILYSLWKTRGDAHGRATHPTRVGLRQGRRGLPNPFGAANGIRAESKLVPRTRSTIRKE